jgi:tetratricopeptide (TPR) repeat protein
MKPRVPARLTGIVLTLALAAGPLAAQPSRAPAPEGCGETHNLYGPFDYRTATPQQRFIVENAHFTRGVETLTKGATGPFGGDIGYTLAVFPNHPRAILTLERLIAREKADPPPLADMSLECYYARGMRFASDDLVFRMLYVSFLIRRERLDEAHRFLDYVVEQSLDSPLTQFNAGLLFFDMKDYDRALTQAHRAMALGMARQDLRDRLQSVGRWKDPEPATAADAASAPAAAATPRPPAASAASQPSH